MSGADPAKTPAPAAAPVLTPSDSLRSFLTRWRALQRNPPAQLRPLTIAVTASFTVELLLPYLGVLLAQRGLLARFVVAPFNQIQQSLLDPQSPLRAERADVTLVLPRLEELCPAPLAALASLRHPADARAAALAEIDRLLTALSGFARNGNGGQVLLGTLAQPPHKPLGVLDAGHAASQAALRTEINLRLWQGVQGAPFRLFDLAGAVAEYGTERAYDERLFYASRCPFSDGFLRRLAVGLCRSIAPLFLAPAKVLALDLDNTLWGGIIGEDGLSGIALGESGSGAAYVAFQEALLLLRQQGVLLCAVSKNNEADALEVFDRHPSMRIHREHLSAHEIGWNPKTESLRRLAERLSLGLSSFVFVDDNPVECEEVRRILPEVTVLQLPRDPAHYVAALRALPALDRMVLTDEDLQRADQYAAEAKREALRAQVAESGDALESYLRSLELSVQVRALRPDDIARAAQLTQKTNQFNLTTKRRSEAEVAALAADPAWRLYTVTVHDRFGAYGLTGLCFAHRVPDDDGQWEIDTLLLSCRVLGRRVESAAISAVATALRRRGAQRLRGRFLPTAKNAPARDFLANHGFVGAQADPQGPQEGVVVIQDAPKLGPDHGHIHLVLED